MRVVLLLIASNTFMTMAWYGHLKWWPKLPLLAVIALSWMLALPEYMLQVPANRLGHATFSAPQLKILQEVISIGVFVVFNYLVLKETIRPTDWLALGLIASAVVVMSVGRGEAAESLPEQSTAAATASQDP
jgi:uncharacterized protein (DUF486 family)